MFNGGRKPNIIPTWLLGYTENKVFQNKIIIMFYVKINCMRTNEKVEYVWRTVKMLKKVCNEKV